MSPDGPRNHELFALKQNAKEAASLVSEQGRTLGGVTLTGADRRTPLHSLVRIVIHDIGQASEVCSDAAQ